MSFVGAIDAPIEIIGGLVSDMAPSEVPPGVSPDCSDVIFGESSVKTRPGLATQYQLTGNVVNYLKTFITSTGLLRAMSLTDLGALYKETAGVATLIQNLEVSSGVRGQSTTLFSREYLAVSDGLAGLGLPRQYDDTFLDRVSQQGPGAAPTAADENISGTIVASPNGLQQVNTSIPALSELGNVVTVTGIGTATLAAGDSVQIAGATVTGYNGTWTISQIINSTAFQFVSTVTGLAADNSGSGTLSTSITKLVTTAAITLSTGAMVTIAGAGVGAYNGTWQVRLGGTGTIFFLAIPPFGTANSGGGTVTAIGNIILGVHQLSVVFVTRQGYLTAPAPPGSWTASGGKRAVITGIPVGPPNVIARILIFTSAGGAVFYSVGPSGVTLAGGNMYIADNVTTTLTVDFTDALLLAGTNYQYLFDLLELGETAGVIDYNERLFWWGERNKLTNFVNMGFDGAFSSVNLPLGWAPDPTFAAGGGSALAASAPVVWGDAYQIVGNGATATRGLVTQSAVSDFFGVPRIQVDTAYSVRARIAKSAGLTQGTVHVHLFSTLGGINTTGISLAAAAVTTTYVEYIAVLTTALSSIPSDLVVRIYADGTPTNAQYFLVDCVEIFPTSQPVNTSIVRASRVEDPESYNGVDGFLSIAESNGQALRCAFKMRERLFFVKERSTHATQDDGVNEPASWTVTQVSATVGTPSVRGVGIGEDWVVIAGEKGLYLYWGGQFEKISQEVGHSASALTLAWDQINWAFGSTLWVTVDTKQRRIFIGAPFGTATSPNFVLMLDYRDLDDPSTIATSPPIRVSYRGVKIVSDKSRKWSPWTMAINSAALMLRADGSEHVFMGAGANSPNVAGVFDLLDTQLTDYTTNQQIPSYYTTCFFPQRQTEQELQLHAHRKLFNYLSMYVEGSGTLAVTAFPLNELNPQPLPSLTLSSPAFKDLEMPINVLGERVAFKMAVSGAASWMRLQKFTPSIMGDPWAPVRGAN